MSFLSFAILYAVINEKLEKKESVGEHKEMNEKN